MEGIFLLIFSAYKNGKIFNLKRLIFRMSSILNGKDDIKLTSLSSEPSESMRPFQPSSLALFILAT